MPQTDKGMPNLYEPYQREGAPFTNMVYFNTSMEK